MISIAALRRLIALLVLLWWAAACTPQAQDEGLFITLQVDGGERTYRQPIAITVGEFLRQVEVDLGPLDEVNPPVFSQLADGMRVTVVRVTEESECVENPLPFRTRTIPNESLRPGEERLAQSGQPGAEQVCYRIMVRDGVRQEPVEVSRVILRDPQDEVIYVGPSGQIDVVPITGTLAYISNNNVWVIRSNSTSKRVLTDTNDVDPRVFSLSDDGRRLLYTRFMPEEERAVAFNRLWMLPDTTRAVDPVALLPQNVIYGDWVPNETDVISYSTAEATAVTPGWDADNNLWVMQIDPISGQSLNAREIVPASFGGLDGWWGTRFEWSPDGSSLAWVRADSIGLVNLNTGELNPLLSYRVFETRQPWSWRATVSWSEDSSLLLTTVHGLPVGNEPPETSPAFHVAVADVNGRFTAEIVRNAGIWSMPKYSPLRQDESGAVIGHIAYLRARELANNVNANAEYDLVVADRDGSNARVIFPQPGETGLRADTNFVWSPDGTQIAFIYRGDLWVIDVSSSIAHRLTLDGNASRPLWTR